MAVTSCNLHREGWIGSGNVADGDKYQTQHLVESNDKNDGPLSIALGAEGSSPHPLPAAWSTYAVGNDINQNVVLKDRDTRLHGYTNTGALWIVTSKYEKPGSDDEEQSTGTNPLLRPTKYRIEWSNYTKIITKELNGQKRAILNSAGQKFADPVEQEDQRLVLVAVRNVAVLEYIINLGIVYKNAVNTNTFYGAAPRHAKVQSITCGDQQTEEDVSYYRMTIRVEFNDEAWDRQFLDQGIVVEDPNNAGNWIAVKDGTATPMGQEMQLDGNGAVLAPGADPVWIDPPYRTYPERDFSGLGI